MDPLTDARNCGGCQLACGAGATCCSGRCADTAIDAAHCGQCGKSCRAEHGAPSCSNGNCGVASCDVGWSNCNMDPADGCETQSATDVNNCGACASRCEFKNAAATCAAGMCALMSCNPGYADCNASQPDGCETLLDNDARNCGACGSECLTRPNAAVACTGGACTIKACDAGYLDCDQKAGTGCEINGSTNTSHCGACGAACPQGTVCSAGKCNCAPCIFPGVRMSSCQNLKCVIDSCFNGYFDCDKVVQNGCEAQFATDVKNCGGCGMACAKGQVCAAGVCLSCIPRPAGAVSFWTGEGNAQDVLGGNHGVEKGGTRYGPGVVGQAFLFDGTGQVVAPSAGLPVGATDRTLELWARIDVNVANEAFFAGWGGFGNQTQAYELFALNNQVQFSQWGAGVAGPNIQVGQWVHVAAVTLNGSTTVYANGVAGNPANLAINTPQGSSFLLGLIPIDNTRRLSGAVDEITVYNRALSAQEIQAIYSAAPLGKCP